MVAADDFETIHWHDNAIHGIRIVEGEDDSGGELILDIDFILEWLPAENNAFKFNLAPADLAFHDGSDLVICVDYASATASVQPMMIHEIHREVVRYPNGYSSYAWKIEINWPPKGFISFRSKGFTQVLRMQPFIFGAQYLSPSQRKP